MSLEQQITKLENELNAIKSAFEKSATQLPVYTYTEEFATEKNQVTVTTPGGVNTYDSYERVLITLDTTSGANTIATLELSASDLAHVTTRRIPYSGGAAWVVTNFPTGQLSGEDWEPTEYLFSVQSAMPGTLKVRMIWEEEQ